MTRHKKISAERERYREERFNIMQQLVIAGVICAFSIVAYLPVILNMELYMKDPDADYDGYADLKLVDISNTAVVSTMSMMVLESLLDANTRYLPIKIAFPRFVMVLGILITSAALHAVEMDGMDRLNFIVCSHYAKAYFLCAGIYLRMLKDAGERGKIQFTVYAVGLFIFMAEVFVLQWSAYYPPSFGFAMGKLGVNISSMLVAIYCACRALLLVAFRADDEKINIESHYYDVMSHLLICVFTLATHAVNVAFGLQPWADTTSPELSAYCFVTLFCTLIFFFTSNYIAGRNFVQAQVSDWNDELH